MTSCKNHALNLKPQYRLRFSPQGDEIFVDLLYGAGQRLAEAA